MHFLSGSVHFSGSAKFQKMARDQKFRFVVTGKIIVPRPLTTASETTINMTVGVYIRSARVSFWGVTRPMA